MTALATTTAQPPSRLGPLPEAVEKALIGGDLKELKPDERLAFYRSRCEAAGLDPRGRPFEYIVLSGKLTLYAKKECAEQLNGMHGLSHEILSRQTVDGLHEVCVRVRSRSGRSGEDMGAVVVDGLRGEALANAKMKAVTKAKRRATLSFCGLGDVIDESELDTVEYRACGETGSPLPIDNQSGFAKGQYASQEQADEFIEKMGGYLQKRNSAWLDRWTQPDGSHPAKHKPELINKFQADGHLVKWGKATGRLNPEIDDSQKARQLGRYTGIIYHKSRADRIAIADELARYCNDQERLATEKLKKDHPELFPDDVVTEGEFDDLTDDNWEDGRE